MKKLILAPVFLLLILGRVFSQQTITCNSDLTWEVSGDGTNYNGTPVEVTPGCLNHDIIECLCDGTTQEEPVVCTCDGALEIWGEPWGCVTNPNGCNIPCSYRPNEFWFRKVVPIGSCEIIRNFHLEVQADNRMEVILNGTTVLTTMNSDWPNCFEAIAGNTDNFSTNVTNVIAGMTPGQDLTIVIHVTNTDGAPCVNYAFLSFCGTFETQIVQLDANFLLSDTDNGNGTSTLTGTATGSNPAQVSHEWYIMRRPYGSTNPFQPIGVIQGGANFLIVSPYCFEYRVIHRVYWGECEACYVKINAVTCEGRREEEENKLEPIDCDEIDLHHWPIIGLKTPGGDEARPGLPQGVDLGESRVAELSVHPNPTNSLLNLTWTGEQMEEIKVLDINGKVVLERKVESDAFNLQLDVSMLPSGVYLIELSNASQKLTKKFSVSK